MCWKLVDDNSGEIINRSTIRSAIEPGSANLQVDPLEPIPKPVDDVTDVLDDFMSLAILEHPFFILHCQVHLILYQLVQNHKSGKRQ